MVVGLEDPSTLENCSTNLYFALTQVHMVKNYVADSFDKNARVPLILGIWGGKGQGKSFQTELAFKKMGCVARSIAPLSLSASGLTLESCSTTNI